MASEAQFRISLFARWPDMDFNQHMRNAAYLGASEDCRMRFLAERGFTIDELRKRMLGPVVVEDRLVYKKELRLLEPFRVELALAAITVDGRRMKVRNTFLRESDDALVAVVESVVLWFDLTARKPVAPPEDLRAAWLALARADDFVWYE
ncbi:MAG TPA: thioesterase family protein [Myxococcaceae bacterium]|nr:thioesterase family protein [Myxococcaceae bacterium]